MKSIKKAIILAGGKGTRLSPLTLDTPKALIDINGKTLTEHLLDILKKFDIRDIILSVGYLSDNVKEYFGNGSRFGVKISYIEEKELLGTAGPFVIMNKTNMRINERMIVMNGDNLFDINFEEMEAHHIKNNALGTIALTQIDDISSFGSVEFGKDGRIDLFREKRNEKVSGWISSGYYILEPAVFEILKGKDFAMLETDVFPLFAEQKRLYGYQGKGLWFDTGTFRRYENAIKQWKGIR